MEIKDKLTARQVAMQMSTDVMCAIAPHLSGVKVYDVNEHFSLAKSLYAWLVGNAELPEVYNVDAQAEKVMDVLMKARENLKPEPVWFKIIPDNALMRKNVPMFLRSKDGDIRVVGSVEEFDRIVESGAISDYYTDYSLMFSPDPENPFERDRKIMGINAAL